MGHIFNNANKEFFQLDNAQQNWSEFIRSPQYLN